VFNIGPLELMVVLLIALVVVGPKRLPEIGRTIGRALHELRKVQTEVRDTIRFDLDTDEDEPPTRAASWTPPGEDDGLDGHAPDATEHDADPASSAEGHGAPEPGADATDAEPRDSVPPSGAAEVAPEPPVERERPAEDPVEHRSDPAGGLE
jgi:Tat protein translocase TatB subunit